MHTWKPNALSEVWGASMKIRHEHSGYFGPAPLHCPCCGTKESQSGCVRGFTCQCDWNWCKKCHLCTKHCQCEKQPEKKSASDFDYIYNDDGTCGARYDCFKPGVILAYDDFNPEWAMWFCEDDWDDLGIAEPLFTIVEDKRTIESPGEA